MVESNTKSEIKTIAGLLHLLTLKDMRGHQDVPREEDFIRYVLESALLNLLVQVDSTELSQFNNIQSSTTVMKMYKELYGNIQVVIDVMTKKIASLLAAPGSPFGKADDVKLKELKVLHDGEIAKLVLECRSYLSDEQK